MHRKDLIRILRENRNLLHGADVSATQLLRLADCLIENGAVVHPWIPVTERLPAEDGTYLVYTERGSVYTTHFYTEKHFRNDYIREANWSQRGKVKVTHWMPLPEPPVGG